MHLVGECLVEQGEGEGEGEHEFDDPGLPADGHGEAQADLAGREDQLAMCCAGESVSDQPAGR